MTDMRHESDYADHETGRHRDDTGTNATPYHGTFIPRHRAIEHVLA